jgi:hypothetical protein
VTARTAAWRSTSFGVSGRFLAARPTFLNRANTR